MKKDQKRPNKDFDYWGTGLNTILAANGLLRWASNNKVEGEKYQNYLNQVHDDDSFNTVYSNMSKDYGNDSYRMLRKGGKLKRYAEGGQEEEDDDSELLSLLFDDEDQPSEKDKITESDIIDQRKALEKERRKLLRQQEEAENDALIQDVMSWTPKRYDYFQGEGSSPSSIEDLMERIGKVESSGNYQAIGNKVTSGKYKGEKALGKYQIMPGNLPSWSKEALGREVDPDEFLRNPQLQEAIALYQMKKIYNKYGNFDDVASVWLSGKPLGKSKAKDVNGKNQIAYVNDVRNAYEQGGTYDLSLDEVQSLINQGYKIKHL